MRFSHPAYVSGSIGWQVKCLRLFILAAVLEVVMLALAEVSMGQPAYMLI
ncbi:MAG: hypothetical protein AB1522_04525 [Chloroflexota bacterium]